MMDWSWITTTGTELTMVGISGVGIYLLLLLFTRLMGLRSFGKMSSFDFGITVAFGSILASTLLTKTPSLLNGGFGLAVLFGIQFLVAKARRRTTIVERLVDNEPLLLMAEGVVLEKNLTSARMTDEDLKAKLRQAGITNPQRQVFAVVFETTGDVSVLKKGEVVDPWIFQGVRGAEALPLDQAPASS